MDGIHFRNVTLRKRWQRDNHVTSLTKCKMADLRFQMSVTKMDTPKYGETLTVVYIKYQPILV